MSVWDKRARCALFIPISHAKHRNDLKSRFGAKRGCLSGGSIILQRGQPLRHSFAVTPPLTQGRQYSIVSLAPLCKGSCHQRRLRGCPLGDRGKGKGGSPSPISAPNQLFELLRCSGRLIFRFRTDPPSVRRCSARLIRQAETLELQPLRGLRWAGEASLPPAPLSPTTRALRDGRTLRNVCHDGLKKCPSF